MRKYYYLLHNPIRFALILDLGSVQRTRFLLQMFPAVVVNEREQ